MVVVGGGSVGLDVIEYFRIARRGVYHRGYAPQIGMLADPITKCSMRETHDKYGVKEYVNTALQEVKENAFTVKLPDGTIEDLNFDLGFNCLGMRANNRFWNSWKRHLTTQIPSFTRSETLSAPAVSWRERWKDVRF